MIDELLLISKEKCGKLLKKLKLDIRRKLFDDIPTLTDELGLDKIADFETRVKLRAEHIQKFPDTVFWDYCEYIQFEKNNVGKYLDIKISTDGDVVRIEKNGRLIISSGIIGLNKISRYTKLKLKYHSRPMHRIVAHLFIPKPHRLKNIAYQNLEINHIDRNGRNNQINNLEWVTREENQQHAKRNKDYDKTAYFLFEVIVENPFKGRKFILPYSDIGLLGLKKQEMGYTKRKNQGQYKGMKFTKIYEEDVDHLLLGLPEDIRKALDKNPYLFSIKLKPFIGEVLIGKYKGLIFSLYSCNDSFGLFTNGNINNVIKGKYSQHNGCSFRWGTSEEIKCLCNNFTQQVAENIKINLK